jgi:hypothetical protein
MVVLMKWPWVSRKKLRAVEREYSRAFFEAMQCVNKAIELCKDAHRRYDELLTAKAALVDKSELVQLEKERDLANLRFVQLSKAHSRLQMKHDPLN